MRFISEDTNKGDVKDPLSLNLYTYCQGNPIRLVDIDGHSPRIAGPSLDMSFSEFMSSVLSIIPVIGDAKDFHEALTGIDTITGEEISKSGRWITLACALVPFVPGKTGRELIGGAGKASLPNAENLKMSQTVQNHMNDIIKKGPNAGQLSRPYIDSNGTTLLTKEIMNGGTPVKDASLANGLRWDVQGTFRGSTGTWELVVDLDTNTVVHFNFVTK